MLVTIKIIKEKIQFLLVILFLLIFSFVQNTYSQMLSLDSLLKANSYEFTINLGVPEGKGFDLLLEAAQNAQFFSIAEEHNVSDLNNFASLLFTKLQEKYGFKYIALEQGSVITSWLGNSKHRGNMKEITSLINKYPQAPTFGTDEELQMISQIGAISTAATNPIWGIDQEIGVLHIFERLAELAPNDTAASIINKLVFEARKYELDRFGDIHYVAQVLKPDDLSDLTKLFHPISGSETEELIKAIKRTNRIYYNYILSRKGFPTAYENGREREESMKLRFMENYRKAQNAGDSIPRVLAKLGHWHIFRGIYKSNVPTFGNFLSEFAISNGMHTFVLSTHVIDSPEKWRNAGDLMSKVAGDSQFTVIDFRPIRAYAHQKKILDLSDSFKKLLFRADAALIIRGGKTGNYKIVKGINGE